MRARSAVQKERPKLVESPPFEIMCRVMHGAYAKSNTIHDDKAFIKLVARLQARPRTAPTMPRPCN